MRKGPIYTIMFMFLITAFFTGILASANHVTRARVNANQELKVLQSHLYAFGIQLPPSQDIDTTADLYNSRVQRKKLGSMEVFVARKKSGEIEGYGIPFRGPGLWGTIEGFVALSADKAHVLGMDIISQSETPGLGARIDEAAFKDQFRGISLLTGSKPLKFKPNEPDGQIDAVTGASITSAAVEKMMNDAIRKFLKRSGGDS